MWYVKDQINDISSMSKNEFEPGLLSIVVPVYDKKLSTLCECLSSLDGLEYENFEILVCYAGNQNVKDMVSGLKCSSKIRVVQLSKNLGASFGRNTGAIHSMGEYIWFLDSDVTQIDKGAAACAVDFLQKHPEAGMIGGVIYYSDHDLFYEAGAFNSKYLPESDIDLVVLDKYINTASAFMRRGLFIEAGGFTEIIEYMHDDYDLCYKLRMRGYECYGLPKCAGFHPVNTGYSLMKEFMAWKNILIFYSINASAPSDKFFSELPKICTSKHSELPRPVKMQAKREFPENCHYAMTKIVARLLATAYTSLFFLRLLRERFHRKGVVAK